MHLAAPGVPCGQFPLFLRLWASERAQNPDIYPLLA
jgi:hypothetical protein